jgi:hypothetical protein
MPQRGVQQGERVAQGVAAWNVAFGGALDCTVDCLDDGWVEPA